MKKTREKKTGFKKTQNHKTSQNGKHRKGYGERRRENHPTFTFWAGLGPPKNDKQKNRKPGIGVGKETLGKSGVYKHFENKQKIQNGSTESTGRWRGKNDQSTPNATNSFCFKRENRAVRHEGESTLPTATFDTRF